jgi:ankyrin repeat protein
LNFDVHESLGLNMPQEPDCVNTRRLDTELQHQLVDAYRATLHAASFIATGGPAGTAAQSYILQCSWVLIIFRFGSIGAWSGSFAQDVLPLAWSLLQHAQGREKQTVLSLLFSIAETYPRMEQFLLSEIIHAAMQAALEGVFAAVFFLRRYRNSGLSASQYFFGPGSTIEMSEETVTALARLEGLAGTNTDLHANVDNNEHQSVVDHTENILIGMELLLSDQKSSLKPKGYSPLLQACRRGQTSEVLALLNHGHDATALSQIGESCLHWLYNFPDDEIATIASQLYDRGADPLAVAEESAIESRLESSRHKQLGLTYNDNPLCRSVSIGNIVSVEVLIRLLRRVNLDVSAKFSVLYEVSVLAASLHMAEILKHVIFELESQCRSLLDNYLGEWRFAAWRSHLFRAATLVEVEICRFSLHGRLMEVAMRDTFVVLENHGNIPDLVSPAIAMTKEPVHPIFMAIKLGSQRVCTHIIFHTRWGERPDVIEPSTGYTALCWAMQENWTDFFDALVQKGAILDFAAQYPEGHFLANSQSTYLHLCAEMRSKKYFAEQLIRRGVPTGLSDSYDRSVLYLCICKDAIDTARVLLQNGEDLNQTDSDGFTLLGQLLRLKNRRRVNYLERAIK